MTNKQETKLYLLNKQCYTIALVYINKSHFCSLVDGVRHLQRVHLFLLFMQVLSIALVASFPAGMVMHVRFINISTNFQKTSRFGLHQQNLSEDA